jgi:hypothetical protein
MARRHYQVFRGRTSLPGAQKVLLALCIFVKICMESALLRCRKSFLPQA